MTRKIVMAGNWKMNQSNSALSPYLEGLLQAVDHQEALTRVDIVFSVPFTLLGEASRLFAPKNLHIASQNVHWAESGAFTGEISCQMLKELNVGWAVIGHSERRQYFGETNATVAQRMGACLQSGLIPIVCIGETLEERESGRMEDVLRDQVQPLLPLLKTKPHIVVAYEPVWAIGTGKTATPDQAEEAHFFVRKLFAEGIDKAYSESLRILYGGSANPSNIDELLANPNVDGALVGGASLKPTDFAAMINSAYKKVCSK